MFTTAITMVPQVRVSIIQEIKTGFLVIAMVSLIIAHQAVMPVIICGMYLATQIIHLPLIPSRLPVRSRQAVTAAAIPALITAVAAAHLAISFSEFIIQLTALITAFALDNRLYMPTL